MKSRKILIFVLILLILLSISSVSAIDSNNITIDQSLDETANLADIESENIIESPLEDSENIAESSSDDSEIIGDDSKTIYVDPAENPNQVLFPTVQPAINNANPGDTLILDGEFVHCHFTINKTLNIIATEGTTVGPCPHHTHKGLYDFGVFYITPEGSVSVIQGFTFLNGNSALEPFNFYIEGASDVTIKDCTLNLIDPNVDKYTGITIKNSNNIILSNLFINNTIDGIKIINSSNILIKDCEISNGETSAISIMDNSKNITILSNRIINNANYGISLTSANNINISNNLIQDNGKYNENGGSGIYVNTNITKIIVKGNIFLSNGCHAILYDYRVRNLNNNEGDELLTIVDNNYFAGHTSMILHHITYIEHPDGDMDYDEINDIYYYVGQGKYIESKAYSYMQHAFVLRQTICGYTHYTPDISWALDGVGNEGNYDLTLTPVIKQVKKGVYQVSLVDSDGNIAQDFSSFDVIFFLNNFTTSIPTKNDVYKIVKIENGIATADFTDLKDNYLKTGNMITASLPSSSKNGMGNPLVELKINDFDIPGALNNTQIKITDLKVNYGLSNYLTATLYDVNGNNLHEKDVSIVINSKTYNVRTDNDGKIKLSLSLNSGIYTAKINFKGDEDYASTFSTSKITILKVAPKLTYSKLTTYPLSNGYFKVKLTGVNGKVISNQKITFKINGKSYTVKTDKNGIAKVKVYLTNKKTYSVKITYLGNNNYNAISKTGKIVVKTGSVKSKIKSKNLKIKKNSKKTFSFKLTSKTGKAISKQLVLIKLNGKTYTVKTNAKGIAKKTIKLKAVKKYKISIRFLGNSIYKPVSKTNILTVVK